MILDVAAGILIAAVPAGLVVFGMAVAEDEYRRKDADGVGRWMLAVGALLGAGVIVAAWLY